MTPALVELRVLEGPNLYFPRAAVKLTLDLTRLVEAPTDVALRFATRVGLRTSRPGEAGWSDRSPLGWDEKDTGPTARSVVALLSDFFPATTGEIVHVDGGYHAMGA